MGAVFSIIIPARDAGDQFEQLMRAVAGLDRPSGGFEVVVVDDGSSEHIDQLVARHRGELPVRLLAERGFSGPSHCRELGWRAASGEIAVFLDPDMLVPSGWLTAYEHALAGGADIVSGARPHKEPILGAIERELARWCEREVQGVLVAFGAQAANLAVRRAALERTTGFNTCLRRFGDIELGIRMWENGARFAYSADAHVTRQSDDGARETHWLDDDEALAMFWRHPYADVMRLQLWAKRRQAGHDISLTWLDQPWDTDELHREFGARGPGMHDWAEDDLIEHFEKVDGLSPEYIRSVLDRAVAHGLYHEVREGTRYFRVDRIDFWMRDTTTFLQRIYQNDLAQALYQPDPDFEHPATLLATAQVRVQLDPDALRAAGVDRLNIALPTERCGQQAVEIKAASTPALLAAARAGSGMLVGFPVSSAIGSDGWMALDFTYKVQSPMTGVHDDAVPASLLRTTLPDSFRPRAEQILKQVGARKDPFETAAALYEWVQDNLLFGVIPPQFPYYRVLDFGVGNCIQQTRLYVALCRLAGIPAREACGVLLHSGGEEKRQVTKEVKARGFGPFAHTWAEFHTPDRGWVPVEIQGFGRQGFTQVAMPEPKLRAEVERVLYRRYPFGTMHPFRIVTGSQANRLSLLLLPEDVDPFAAQRALEATFHRVTCTFTRA